MYRNANDSKEEHILSILSHQVDTDYKNHASWSVKDHYNEVARRYAKEKVTEWTERYGTFVYKVSVIAGAVGFCIGAMAVYFLIR